MIVFRWHRRLNVADITLTAVKLCVNETGIVLPAGPNRVGLNDYSRYVLHWRVLGLKQWKFYGDRSPPSSSGIVFDSGDFDYRVYESKEKTLATSSIGAYAPLKHPDRFFINGQWDAPSSASKIDVVNCVTEEVFLRVAEAQEADVNRAVAAARATFDRGPWPRMSHAERAKYLRAIAKEI